MFQIVAQIARFVYPAILFAFAFLGFYLYLVKPSAATCRDFYVYQFVLILIFNLISFLIIVLKMVDSRVIEEKKLFIIGLYCLEMGLMYLLLCTLHKHTNRLLWNCVYMLLSVSFVVLVRLNPDEAMKQVMWIAVGFLACNLVLLLFRGRWIWRIPSGFFLLISLGMIVMPFVFPSEAGGSLNWVSIKGVSFQPSEFVKLTFAFFLAVLYTNKKQIRSVIEAGIVTVLLAGVLLIQNDLGALLIFGILAWMMTYDYTGRGIILWGGAIMVLLSAAVAYRFVGHVQVRFDIWRDPWSDINGSGYQIAQSLFAIVGGGWFGMGLYQGVPGYIPVNTSDMIFSVIAEEMGMVFCIILLLIYLLMFLFVMETGRREKNVFRRNLLIAFGVLFMSQTFIIVGGVIKLIPLTGVTLPFISYGGSSLFSNFVTIAIIEAVIRLYRRDREEARNRERQRREALIIQQQFAAEDLGEPVRGVQPKVYSEERRSSGRQQTVRGTQSGRRNKDVISEPYQFDDLF